MQNFNRFVLDRAREIDETHRLVEAIARELWLRYGGGQMLDWAAVDRQLDRIVELARSDARDVRVIEPQVAAVSHEPSRHEETGWGKFPHRHRRHAHR